MNLEDKGVPYGADIEGGMFYFKSGDARLRLPGLDLLSGGSRRDAQGRRRILGVGPLRDLCAYDLGWRDTPGAHSLRLVRKGRHSPRHSVTVEMSPSRVGEA